MKVAQAHKDPAARTKFVRWLKLRHPAFYMQVEQKAAGLGDVNASIQNVLDTTSSLLRQYVTSKEQLSLLKANLSRAKAGLPPVDTLPRIQFNAPEPGVPTWLLVSGGVLVLWAITRN